MASRTNRIPPEEDRERIVKELDEHLRTTYGALDSHVVVESVFLALCMRYGMNQVASFTGSYFDKKG
uniref:Uncharacterized protein n=1 Tax=Candidatus Kentrum sp. LPFa TaxID=2126335 RepID=A0A450WK76_9GAMM|nr:MAG: hypothetical protein BECKLPF1236B_GA0070989_111713 [Candidatus Kentron sp. LPFa]